MATGYFLLAIPGNSTLLYVSLLCVIVGNGFFKPNISTLLGNMYNREDLKPLKDNAYNIFYMGINLGAFFCNFIAAILRNKIGWQAAFSKVTFSISASNVITRSDSPPSVGAAAWASRAALRTASKASFS